MESDVCVVVQSLITSDINVQQRNIFALFPLIYGVPSIILCILVVKLLLSKHGRQEFSGRFYLFYAIASISDACFWITYFYIQRLSSAPIADALYLWIPKDGIILSILYFLVCYLGFTIHLNSIILSFNRLTFLVFPFSDEKLWNKITIYIIIFYLLFPIVFSWQYLILDQTRNCRLFNLNSTDAFHLFAFQKPIYWINLFISVTFIGVGSAIIGFVLNSITIISLLIKRYKGLLINNGKPEIKLFIIALIMFVHEFILGIIFAGLYITNTYYPSSQIPIILLAIQPFVADLAVLSPSWMLLISSRRIREALFEKYIARSNQAVEVTPVQVVSSSR